MDFSGYVTENAIPLATLDPGAPFDDLEPLAARLASARVIAIGENAHLVSEFYLLRHRLQRFLTERLGFTVYAMESGFSEGQTVDAWVRGDLPAGELQTVAETGITYNMGKCAEMRNHLTSMRNGHQPVRFVGLDVPGSTSSPLPTLDRLRSYLQVADPEAAPLVDRLTTLASRYAGEHSLPAYTAYHGMPAADRDQLTATYAELSTRLDALQPVYQAAPALTGNPATLASDDAPTTAAPSADPAAAVPSADPGTAAPGADPATAVPSDGQATPASPAAAGHPGVGHLAAGTYPAADGYPVARHELRLAVLLDQAMRGFAAQMTPGDTAPIVHPKVAPRDRGIAETVLWALEHLGPDTKIIVAAHNNHIQRIPVHTPAFPLSAAGHHLASRFGSSYIAIGVTCTSGRTVTRRPDSTAPSGVAIIGTDLEAPDPNSIEALMPDRLCALDLRPARAAAITPSPDRIRILDRYQQSEVVNAYDLVINIPSVTPTAQVSTAQVSTA
ncbi:MAG TPA: erythromycin esterase family protein [Actinoplanes sp.]|nr:erythromycin esterase family protein [Actinoplanes sp.]